MVPTVINHKAIKSYNRRKILNLLSVKRELTRQAISMKTNISIPTVSANIQELIEEGLVEEAGTAESTGGRKALIVRYLPDSKVSFGVEIKTEKVGILLSNLDSKILFETELVMESFGRINDVMARTSAEIGRIQASLDIPEEKVLGIGFSLPGTVNQKKMALELAPNLGMKDISFKSFEKLFRFPIFIENEANAGALAEMKLGKLSKSSELVYVSVTSGIGTGLIIHGKLYKGRNQRAGEFGHMTVIPGGKLCNCGRKGCWELYASEKALLGRYNESKGFENPAGYSIPDFLESLKSGEKSAQNLWYEYLDYFALGIQNIMLGLDPQVIVIGGKIGLFGDMLIEPLRERVFTSLGFEGAGDVLIATSRLGFRAPTLGAAILPIQEYLE
jgi:predicted NBD/HSP70 family sugar kinase